MLPVIERMGADFLHFIFQKFEIFDLKYAFLQMNFIKQFSIFLAKASYLICF
jgi:hypothetical protein